MKPLVIYHANCADGFGAAFAAWLKFGDEAEYLPMKYGENTRFFGCNYSEPAQQYHKFVEVRNREVYILDFSLPKDVMDWLLKEVNKVVWLDHHKTAFEMWCPTERSYYREADETFDIILDNNRSGALIAWEYFHPEKEVPLMIKHIDDYDRWQFKLEGTKEFNKALWSYAPWSFEQWNDMFSPPESVFSLSRLMGEGAAILRAHDQNVTTVVKGAKRECIIPVLEECSYIPAGGLSANCPPHLASDVGHQLANQSGTYGLLWHIGSDGKCKCSLRSNGDYDVSAIAKVFGGGGHKNAAGFEIDIQTLLEWIK